MNNYLFRITCMGVLGFVAMGFTRGSAKETPETPWCELSDPVSARSDGRECPPQEPSQLLPDTLVLPMPCDQYMIFRKVVVPGNHLLDNQELVLGGAAKSDIGSEILNLTLASHEEVLSGSFAHGEGERNTPGQSALDKVQDKSFYIGMYEVLESQYDLLVNGGFEDEPKCEGIVAATRKLSSRTIRPAVNVSWFDAVRFSQEYSNWLIRAGQEQISQGKEPFLPWEHGSSSYLRLPAEVEWEYAARGGVARPQDVYNQAYRIVDPETNEIREAEIGEVAVLASRSGRGEKLRPVGTRPANIFGLYDMVGNADEIMLDPFRATRPDASLGQLGGYTVKGGNVQTPEELIGVGYRREVPFFDTIGEVRSETTGFRLVVSTPVFLSGVDKKQPWHGGSANPQFIAAVQSAQTKLGETAQERVELTESFERLKQELENETVEQDQLLKRIEVASKQLEQSNAKLKQNSLRVLSERFRSSVFMVRNINQLGSTIVIIENRIPDIEKLIATSENRAVESKLKERMKSLRELISDREKGLNASIGVYVDQVSELSKSNNTELDDVSRQLAKEFVRTGLNGFLQYIDMALGHIGELQDQNGRLAPEKLEEWRLDIDPTRSKRSAYNR